MAPTHAAVRLLGKGAMTMHKAVQARFGQSWTKEALELNGEALKEMRSRWNPLMATVIDELSMAAPEVYHALGFRSALARRVEHDLDVDKYMQQWFGKMPIGIQLGDFMQLRPATKRSLCEWIDETFTEEELNAAGESTASELGRYLFKDSFTHVVQFHGTGRFSTCNDGKDLVELLACMRAGRKMPDALWAKLKAQEIDLDGDDARLHDAKFDFAHEGAFVWEIVARLQQLRAMRDAAKAGKRLYYVQAVDQYVDNSRTMMRSDTLEALQVVNLTNTGLLMGMVPLFQGMQVRVSANVAKNVLLTRELLGVVVGIKPHRREPKQPFQESTSFEPYIFKYLPSCVLVELDDPI